MDRGGEPRRGSDDVGRRVFVHVGSPKTGTTGVQDTLWRNRGVLADHGVHYPADRFDEHFLAALDLQQLTWGGLERQAAGALQRLVERANAVTGTVVISSEVFAAASAEQAQRMLGALDGEVHVVLSARDLARQVPAEWQELVKHRHRLTYGDFLADLASDRPARRATRWFWSVQHWPDVLERWGATLPSERVHVVTVPPAGADHELLTNRFWDLFGIHPAWLTENSPRANAGLDAAAVTALRRLNERLRTDQLASEHFRPLVREAIVHAGMGGRPGKPSVTLPPDLAPVLVRLTDEWLARLRERAYDVVGNLDELVPRRDEAPWCDPDLVPSQALLEATEVMLDLAIQAAADRHDQRDRFAEEMEDQRDRFAEEIERFRLDLARERARADDLAWLRQHPVLDVKRRVVDASRARPGVAAGLRVYRAVRDRVRGSREVSDDDAR